MTSSHSFWQRIRRTPYQALASIFMIFITLFVTAIFLVLAGMSTALLSYFESKPQVSVFFKDEKDKAAVDQLVAKLNTSGKIAAYKYISKEEALAIYREQNKNDPLLLEMVTADILPASLEISAVSPAYLVELAEVVKKEPGIDEVVFQKDVVDALVVWTSAIRKVGAVFILFLLLSTFFILLTSIGMKIAFRKEEIEILKLVGASNWYIKKPFVNEGLLYGFAGALLAFLVVSVLILYLSPFINSFLRGISTLPLWQFGGFTFSIWPLTLIFFVILGGVIICSGLLIGLMGSLFALSRYMRHSL